MAHRVQYQAARARLSPAALRLRLERLGGSHRHAGVAAAPGLTALSARRTDRLATVSRRLTTAHAANLRAGVAQLARRREQLGVLHQRGLRALTGELSAHRRRLAAMDQLLRALSYRGVLGAGYALVRDAQGRSVHAASQVGGGMRLEVEFADGRIGVVADGGSPPPEPKKAARAGSGGGGQPSLFDT